MEKNGYVSGTQAKIKGMLNIDSPEILKFFCCCFFLKKLFESKLIKTSRLREQLIFQPQINKKRKRKIQILLSLIS